MENLVLSDAFGCTAMENRGGLVGGCGVGLGFTEAGLGGTAGVVNGFVLGSMGRLFVDLLWVRFREGGLGGAVGEATVFRFVSTFVFVSGVFGVKFPLVRRGREGIVDSDCEVGICDFSSAKGFVSVKCIATDCRGLGGGLGGAWTSDAGLERTAAAGGATLFSGIDGREGDVGFSEGPKRDGGFGGGSGEENGSRSVGYDDSEPFLGGEPASCDSGASSGVGGVGSFPGGFRVPMMRGEVRAGRLGEGADLMGGVGWAFCAAGASFIVSRKRVS